MPKIVKYPDDWQACVAGDFYCAENDSWHKLISRDHGPWDWQPTTALEAVIACTERITIIGDDVTWKPADHYGDF